MKRHGSFDGAEMRAMASRAPLGVLGRLAAFVFAQGVSAAAGAGLAAQEPPSVRVLAVVDYVAGSELYLATGTEFGIREGDTLPALDGEGEGARLLGFLTIRSATGRRSVGAFVDTPFPVSRGDLLYLDLPRALAEERMPPSSQETPHFREGEQSGVSAAKATPEALRVSSGHSGPAATMHGRVALDLDAFRTTTRWGPSLEEASQRTYSIPTLRFQFRGRDLPGGLRLRTSIRLSHRNSPSTEFQRPTSLRFYQLEVEKRFEALPVQLHLGRFHNPFDDFSGYWDGAMLHVGGGGVGVGVSAGFEPELGDEGVSTERPKLAGFLDLNARSDGAEYEGAVSVQTLRSKLGEPDRTYVGVSQGIRLGSAWLRQRLRVDRSAEGTDWSPTRIQLDATLPLPGGLSLYGGWRRWRRTSWQVLLPEDSTAGTPATGVEEGQAGSGAGVGTAAGAAWELQTDRANAGISLWRSGGGMSADVSFDRREGEPESRTISASFHLFRTPVLGFGFSGMASRWSRGEDSSLMVSPEVRRDLGRGEIRGAYRFYQTGRGETLTRYESAELSLSFPMGAGLWARVQGSLQWGEALASNRLFLSLWKAF